MKKFKHTVHYLAGVGIASIVIHAHALTAVGLLVFVLIDSYLVVHASYRNS